MLRDLLASISARMVIYNFGHFNKPSTRLHKQLVLQTQYTIDKAEEALTYYLITMEALEVNPDLARLLLSRNCLIPSTHNQLQQHNTILTHHTNTS